MRNVQNEVTRKMTEQTNLKLSEHSMPHFSFHSKSNHQKPITSLYLARLQEHKKQTQETDQNASSFFPPPLTDVRKSVPVHIENTQTGNGSNPSTLHHHREWKSVPAPLPQSLDRRSSESSIEPSVTARLVSMAPLQTSDDNQNSTATVTESLGTKITKFATGVNPFARKKTTAIPMENLNLNQNYDSIHTNTLTSDTEQGLYSDRQATHRDQTGLFSSRDDPHHEGKCHPVH
jgi:hypothetical protein